MIQNVLLNLEFIKRNTRTCSQDFTRHQSPSQIINVQVVKSGYDVCRFVFNPTLNINKICSCKCNYLYTTIVICDLTELLTSTVNCTFDIIGWMVILRTLLPPLDESRCFRNKKNLYPFTSHLGHKQAVNWSVCIKDLSQKGRLKVKPGMGF